MGSSGTIARRLERAEFERAKVSVLFGNTNAAIAGNLLNGLILCVGGWNRGFNIRMLLWLAVGVLVHVGRWALMRSYRRRGPKDARRWAQLFSLGAFCTGLWWFCAAPWFVKPCGTTLLMVYFFLTTGLCAGSSATIAIYLPAVLGFTLPMLSGVAYCLFAARDEARWLIAGAIILFATYIAALAANVHRLLARALVLRFHRAKLVYELKQAKRELEASHAQLEQRVRQRTRSLEQETVARLDAQRRLQRAARLEAVGRLTGGIAHDFNNNLTVVLNCLELIAQGQGDLRENLEAARQATQNGAELTKNLLAFSRQASLEPSVQDISQLVRALERPMILCTLPQNIRFLTHAPQGTLRVMVDKAQLESAILNLVLNARDAMPTGGHLEVRAQAKGDQVSIRVIDQGKGIPKASVERVFEPFFSTKGDKGTGLGLSMVLGFAKQSGGDVQLDTGPTGTCVEILLPRYEGGQRTQDPRATQELKSLPMGSGQKILVAEDNPAIRSTTKDMLNHLGYRAQTVPHAQAALEVLERQDVALLLTDMRMPGPLNGLALAKEVAQRWPQIPVILVSGHAPELAGDHGHVLLRKPYGRRALATAIHRCLHEARGPRPLVPGALKLGRAAQDCATHLGTSPGV